MVTRCSKALFASFSVRVTTLFSKNGSFKEAAASKTWNCHWLRESIALAKLGAEQARTAREAISGGTGVTKSGRAVNKFKRAASSTLRR